MSQRRRTGNVVTWLGAALVCSLAPWIGTAQQWGRDRDFDVRHYRIEVGFDWAARSVTGRTTITARPLRSGIDAIVLDAADMTIASVTLAGGGALQYSLEDAQLRIRLDRPRPSGEDVSIVVAHSGVPSRGLRFVDGGDPASFQIWTVGQTTKNHHWFPSYDSPNDLATVETIVAVPDRFRVIANGVLEDTRHDRRRNVTTYHWAMPQPIATYLVSLVVGDFAEIEHAQSPPVRSYVPRSRLADARRSLAETGEMIAFFADYLGVPYPYDNYKQTIVRDFPGGIENASATTLGESVVYDRRAALDEEDAARLLMAHEAAHQWFGNLVTCRDWSDVWLHEGFATHLAHLYANRGAAREDDLRYAVLQAQRRSQDAWSGGNRRPLATTGYATPEALFDVHAYATGAVVLDMLRFVLGPDAWRSAMRQFLRRNAYANVTTADLQAAVEDSTGKAVGWFFDQWVRTGGFPDLTVSYSYDAASRNIRLSVTQSGRPYRMPVDVAVTTARGERIHRIWLGEPSQQVTLPVDDAPLIVNFDRGGRVMKLLRFEKSATELAYQARHDTDAIGRVWAANALKGSAAPEAETVLIEMMTRDRFWAARVEAARALAGRRGAGVRAAALAALADQRPIVRREAARLLGSFPDDEIWNALRRAVDTDESYYVVREAARALVAGKAPDAFAILERLLTTRSEKDLLRVAALDLFATLGAPAAFDLAFPYAIPEVPPAVQAAALRAIATLGGAASRHMVLDRLTSALAAGPEAVKLAAVDGLERLPDRAAIPHLRAAADAPAATGPNDALLRRRIRDLLRKLESGTFQE